MVSKNFLPQNIQAIRYLATQTLVQQLQGWLLFMEPDCVGKQLEITILTLASFYIQLQICYDVSDVKFKACNVSSPVYLVSYSMQLYHVSFLVNGCMNRILLDTVHVLNELVGDKINDDHGKFYADKNTNGSHEGLPRIEAILL